jgi:hypothetical protein
MGVEVALTTPGDGEHFPVAGDKLTMHYTGTLVDGGARFDCSRAKGQPFEFTIGEGEAVDTAYMPVLTPLVFQVRSFEAGTKECCRCHSARQQRSP